MNNGVKIAADANPAPPKGLQLRRKRNPQPLLCPILTGSVYIDHKEL
jgi:hypothetical protein